MPERASADTSPKASAIGRDIPIDVCPNVMIAPQFSVMASWSKGYNDFSDVFGLESGTIHRLAAEAIIDTTVRLVKRRSLEQAAGIDVQVARKLWAMTSAGLKHAEDHMLLPGRKTAMERVATFLLKMDRRLAVAGMMALPMCRRDIGDYLGLTLETVSRALSQLHAQGVLGFSGARQIVLRNRARLRNMDA